MSAAVKNKEESKYSMQTKEIEELLDTQLNDETIEQWKQELLREEKKDSLNQRLKELDTPKTKQPSLVPIYSNNERSRKML